MLEEQVMDQTIKFAGDSYSVRAIDRIEDFLGLKSVWNIVLTNSKANSPFLTFEWLTTWWKYFGGKKRLYILLLRKNLKLVAIAPLMMSYNFGTRTLELIGTGRSDYLNFIISGEISKEKAIQFFFEFLKNFHTGWDVISLRAMSLSENVEKLYQKYSGEQGFHYNKVLDTICPYLPINSSWEDYLATKTSKDRNNMKRWKKIITKKGKVDIISKNTVFTGEILHMISHVEAQSWKHEVGNPRLLGEQASKFFEDVFGEFGQHGWLEIWVLLLNREPIGYSVNFFYNNKIYFYNIAYAQSYAKCYPGAYLTTLAIQHSFDRKVTEFDFLRGDEPYKFFWTQASRPLSQIVVHQDTLKANLLFFVLFKLRWFLREYAFFKKLLALKIRYSYKVRSLFASENVVRNFRIGG